MQSSLATVARGAVGSRPEPRPFDRFVYDHVGADGRLEGRLRIARNPASPALKLGLDLLDQPHTILLGFSPGNGYFNTKRVEIVLCGFAQLSGDVTVVVPDTIAAHTYRARGYSEADSDKSARTQGRDLKRRCQRGLERCRVTSPSASMRVLDWERDVWADARVTAAHTRIEQLFETDAGFRAQTIELVHGVLGTKVDSEQITPAALREGANYVLKELAFIAECRETFGVDVIIPYPRPWALGTNFCEGMFGDAVPGVGWMIYDIEVFQ